MDASWLTYIAHQIEGLGMGVGLLVVEGGLLGLICLSLILDWTSGRRFLPLLIVGGLGILIIFLVLTWPQEGKAAFGEMIRSDSISQWGKFLLLLSAILVLLMIGKSKKRGEFYPLFLGGVLAGLIAVMARNLILIILALELLSLVSYALVAMEQEDKASARSALQYLLFGLFSSALSLYGLSWLYGLTGTFDLYDPAFIKALNEADGGIVLILVLMVSSNFLFKISAFPFHFWTPQIYSSASYPLLAFLSSLPKIAGSLVLLRFFHAFQNWDDLPSLKMTLMLMAGLSMTWGNLSALDQGRFKALMAFSSVAHAGYILMGLAWLSNFGEAAVLFYIGAYTLMNLSALIAAQSLNLGDVLQGWAGGARQRLWPSISLLVAMVALTGLPPSIGFVGKMYLFTGGFSLLEGPLQGVATAILSLAVVNTLISLFYYLKPGVWLFLKKGSTPVGTKSTSFLLYSLMIGMSLAIILLGLLGFDQILNFLQLHLWN